MFDDDPRAERHLRLVPEVADPPSDRLDAEAATPPRAGPLKTFWANYWPLWLLAVMAAWAITGLVYASHDHRPTSPGYGYCDTRLC